MGMFSALDTAVTGVNVHGMWMDAIADNIANVNTVKPGDEEPFRAEMLELSSVKGSGNVGAGVVVKQVVRKDGEPEVVFDPTNPLADEQGYVRYPDIDMSSQMTQLIMAQRGYQANAAVVDRAKETYQAALQIGRN